MSRTSWPEMGKNTSLLKLVMSVSVAAGGLLMWQLLNYLRRKRQLIRLRPRVAGSVHIVTSAQEWDLLYPLLHQHTQHIQVVGLDCEWVFKERRTTPVALLQISTQQGLCLLVRLSCMPSIPSTLRTFLADRSILKLGVAVNDDGRKLCSDHGLSVNGCLDLRYILPKFSHFYNCDSYGLKGITMAVLNISLNKEQNIRCSDWEADRLSFEQVAYAAADSQAGVDVFTKLVFTHVLGYNPDMWVGAEEPSIRLDVFCRAVADLSRGLVDVQYCSPRRRLRNDLKTSSSTPLANRRNGSDITRAFSPRQRPVRFDCELLAPDGSYLCMCDSLKAEWYTDRNLGWKVRDEPQTTVQLRFMPDTKDGEDGMSKLLSGERHCVVCGAVDCYIRKFLVPMEYRKFFPRAMKALRFHNVLLLCPPCYQVSFNHDAILRQRLAEECNAPLDSGAGAKTAKDFQLQKVIGAAKALKLHRSTIPQHRIEVLEQTLLDYYAVPEVNDSLLEEALTLQTRIQNRHYIPHGKKVVDYHKAHGGVIAFEIRWRQYFLDTMKPKYLPPFWTVEFDKEGN